MKKRYFQILVVTSIIFLCTLKAFAHCEIPCGIYDDKARIKMISEHITTIEKAMKNIIKLQNTKPLNCNQIIRWITNKEKHATEIQDIVSQYFMTQRIKPDSGDYQKKLVLLHKMLVKAMKCKQTTDILHTEAFRALLKEFGALYFEGDKK